jgi:rubrerythrin
MPSAAVQPPPAKARANIALTTHGASAFTPQYHNGASVAAASVTMDAAIAFGLAGAVHAVSAFSADSNSTVPLDQLYWICRACSYTNEEDISRAVFGNTDEGSRVCVICYITSDKKTTAPTPPAGEINK